jgi:hypothetical protein
MNDQELHDVDRAIYGEIYPLIEEIENRLQQGISLAIFTNMARRLATRGMPLDKLITRLVENYEHQLEYNSRTQTDEHQTLPQKQTH